MRIDLPAPVSPVSALKPRRNSTSTLSIIATLEMLKYFNIKANLGTASLGCGPAQP